MCVLDLPWRWLVLAAVVCLTCTHVVISSDEPTLNKEQIKEFLLTAKVVNRKRSNIGITNPWRLTLTHGAVTHDASFQSIDEHKPTMQLASGTELNFVDSYKYNLAAYQLAELLDIDDLLPVYVERKWQGNPGSLSWWLPVKMDEVERHKQKLTAPDADAWNKQMNKIHVFDHLVRDNDPNLTNVLIGENWRIWRIDFTRAFRLSKDLKDQLAEKTQHYLTKDEVKAVMARRDKIVEQFQKLISEKPENDVLY